MMFALWFVPDYYIFTSFQTLNFSKVHFNTFQSIPYIYKGCTIFSYSKSLQEVEKKRKEKKKKKKEKMKKKKEKKRRKKRRRELLEYQKIQDP